MKSHRGFFLLTTALACGCSASDPAPPDGEGTTSGASGSAAGGVVSGGSSGSEVTSGGGGTSSSGAAGSSGMGGAPSGSAGATGGTGTGGTTSPGTGNRPCGKLFYSGEPGEITLASGSTWSDPRGTAGTSVIKEITDNPHSGTTALMISLDWNDGQYGGDYGWSFGNYNATKQIDASTATHL